MEKVLSTGLTLNKSIEKSARYNGTTKTWSVYHGQYRTFDSNLVEAIRKLLKLLGE